MSLRWVTNQSGGRLRSHVVTTRPRRQSGLPIRPPTPEGYVRTLCNYEWDAEPTAEPQHPVCLRCDRALAAIRAQAEGVGLL